MDWHGEHIPFTTVRLSSIFRLRTDLVLSTGFSLSFSTSASVAWIQPFVVLMCETLVQVYQTLLHTEMVKKLPKPIEAVFNTPSHHRVHHATNKVYLDKNYGGIFIIWDRLFGTFALENETVNYGVHPQINSVNPLKVYFHGYGKLLKQLWFAPNWAYRIQLLIKPPIWAWQQERKSDRVE